MYRIGPAFVFASQGRLHFWKLMQIPTRLYGDCSLSTPTVKYRMFLYSHGKNWRSVSLHAVASSEDRCTSWNLQTSEWVLELPIIFLLMGFLLLHEIVQFANVVFVTIYITSILCIQLFQ
jgi:hypothetical protein